MNSLAPGSDLTSVLADHLPLNDEIVREAFVVGKRQDLACEDVIVLGNTHLAVIDGMSAPFSIDSAARSGRPIALAAGRAVATLPADVDARTAIDIVTAAVAEVEVTHSGPAGAVVAIVSIRRREIWRVGDVHVRIGDIVMKGEKAVDVAMAGFRAAINAALLARGDQHLAERDPGLAAARPLLELQPFLANLAAHPFGYGVIDGSRVPDEYIEIIAIPDGVEIALSTDGYLSPATSLATAELELNAAIREDPLGLGLLSSMAKTTREGQAAPDDRAFIRALIPSNSQEGIDS